MKHILGYLALVVFATIVATAPVEAQSELPAGVQNTINEAARENGFGAASAVTPRAIYGYARETGTSMAWQLFDGGAVYLYGSREPGGAGPLTLMVVHGTILAKYRAIQLHDSRLGLPTSGEIACVRPSTDDRFQRFERGIIYWEAAEDRARVFYGSGDIWRDRRCDVAVALAQPPATKEEPRKSDAGVAATYRVTLLGFQADEQTDDDMFESDGKGDEIFTLVHVGRYGEAIPTAVGRYRSILMGDVNHQPATPERLAVGQLSDQGGIGTGYRFMPRTPARGAAGSLALPMVIYEGRGAAMIVPTIWEWDNNGAFLNQYEVAADRSFLRSGIVESFVRDSERNGIHRRFGAGPLFESTSLGWTFEGWQTPGDGDRPIGERHHRGRTFAPQFLYIDSRIAARLAAQPGAFPPLPAVNGAVRAEPVLAAGALNGMISVRYNGFPGQPKGAYTMFLKVEMLTR